MAKKKVKVNNLGFIVSVLAAVLALVAFFLMFAPAATSDSVSFTGAQLTFGYTETSTVPIIGTEIKTTILNFSFLNLLPYILLVVGIVFNFLTKFCKFSNFISAACYVVAGVLFFLVIVMCVPNIDGGEYLDLSELVQAFKDNLTLGIGAIMAGVLSILAGLASAASMFIKK